jgi:hypothetical protein
MNNKLMVRVVSRGARGKLRIRDYRNVGPLLHRHIQIGVEDCSSDLALRGLPVFRELVGPIPQRRNLAQYETPEVFEALTLKWSRRLDRAGARNKRLPNLLGSVSV